MCDLHRLAMLYGAITAIVMAQTTWVLNYWPFASIRMGSVLLVVFYLVVGLAHQALREQLTRRRAGEYLALALIATVIILWLPVGSR